MALLFLSSGLQSTLLIGIDVVLPTLPEVTKTLQDGVTLKTEAKDHGTYIDVITIYMASVTALFMIFFKTELKRTKAEQAEMSNGNPSKITYQAWN